MTQPPTPPPGAGTLEAWLAYVERLHHRPVDMGLERLRTVAARLSVVPAGVRIVVGGTNGKGSTCAILESILRAAGYRVGRYGSPHLLRFNERARIDGEPVGDAALVRQFEAVEQARQGVSLTYFEFTTLAVLACFVQEAVDVAVLEIGLGGRLDAVNLIDADCAIVTTVDLDHMDYLGPTREDIGLEKAHIYRGGRPAICADPDPPASLLAHARAIGAELRCLGRDFSLAVAAPPARQWNYRGVQADRLALPLPALRGAHQVRNAAGALAVLEALAGRLSVDQHAVRRGLTDVQLAGRFQVIPGRPAIILDVGHNPHAAHALAQALREPMAGQGGRTLAVFGMLHDKDAREVVAAMAPVVDRWHLVPTAGERGQAAAALAARAFDGTAASTAPVPHASVALALVQATAEADPDDRIVVFGSFVVVADALRWLERMAR